jgi:hypothetical protein
VERVGAELAALRTLAEYLHVPELNVRHFEAEDLDTPKADVRRLLVYCIDCFTPLYIAIVQFLFSGVGIIVNKRWLNKNWLPIFIIGLVTMLIGIASKGSFEPDAPLILIPLAFIGLGMLVAFVSVVSFRGSWGRSRT